MFAHAHYIQIVMCMCVLYVLYIIYTRSGARFAHPLLACAWISFDKVYLLHGKLLRA